MKRIMGLIVSLALLAGLLTGCSTSATGSNINTPAAQAEKTPGAGGSGAEEEEAAWPRTIVDATGKEITLTEQPQRIAILHSLYLEYFLALGTPPIASAGASTGDAMKALGEWETLKPYVGTAEIIDLGSARDLNLEAILGANPDVIVTFKGQGNLDKIYEQLEQIAPVILVDFSAPWQEQILACAEIVNKEADAQKLIKEIEGSVQSAKEKLRQHQDKTIAIFRTDGGKAFVTRGNKDYYDTFGIAKPEGYPDDYETLSLEAAAEMNPDYIIFQDFITTSQAFVKTQEASSVWQAMEAIKKGQVVYFDDSLNTFGPLATKLTAEKLIQIISD